MAELLSTKLYIPRPWPSLVSRQRLTERMNAGLDKKLTLVSAPAGFGKTTLLSEWIPDSPRCVTWLSLDEGDNDPTRFWTYMLASLRQIDPGLGQGALALLQSPQAPPITAILTALINDIAAFPDKFATVLDDYHVVDSQPIDTALTFLIDHLPENFHLVITTRVDPALPLARLRARDQLAEFRANDLRFTADESAAFLTQAMGLSLSAQEVYALETRTEGWIAGLQLAALSMQGRDDLPNYIADFTGSHRYILDYLIDEVLERRPKGTRNFLLQTSILDRLCGPLCDAVTGQSQGQASLERLEEANLFLLPLDEERIWYRYHHLFADVLRNRLQAASSSTKRVVTVAEMHRRASAWFEQEGLIDEAIRHALAAPDFERAARLVEDNSITMLQRSEILLIRAWLEQLPDELVRTRPRLILAHGWTLVVTGHVQAFEQWMAAPQARAALAAPDLHADILGELALIRATLARFQREDARALDLAQQALALLSDDDRGLQAGAMYTIGVAHLRQGDLAAASQAFIETVRLGEAKGGPYMAMIALQELSEIQIKQGQLSQATQTGQRAMSMADRWGWQAMPAAGMAHIYLGQVLYERNDLDAATKALSHGVDLLLSSIEQFILAQGYATLARAKLASGDPEGALATLQKGKDWFTQTQVADTGAGGLLALADVRLWIGQGNLSAAARWAQSCHWRTEDTYLGYLQAVTLVRLRLAQSWREPQEPFIYESTQVINRLMAAAETNHWWGQVIELSLLHAQLCNIQGDKASMLVSLERALTLAEPEGYVRTFLDEGEPMQLLIDECRLAIAHRPSDGSRLLAYMDKLLSAFTAESLAPRLAPNSEQQPATSTLPEPISERELEVLHLIQAGFNNQEIAEQLVIAVSTVKTHINNLYGKFGVRSRTQAIAAARELGLFSD